MASVLKLIRWLVSMWPGLIPLGLAVAHYFAATHAQLDWSNINKLIALILQIVGGLIVLYAIDSTLGVVGSTSLGKLFLEHLKRFPLLKRSVYLEGASAEAQASAGLGKMRTGLPKRTLEEKIENLQQQIDWLKEDLGEEIKGVKSQLAESDRRHQQAETALRNSINKLKQEFKELSIGGVKTQIFGVLLVIHGAAASYYT
jgi:hypothetical protein